MITQSPRVKSPFDFLVSELDGLQPCSWILSLFIHTWRIRGSAAQTDFVGDGHWWLVFCSWTNQLWTYSCHLISICVVCLYIYIYLYNCIILYIIIYIHKHKVQIYLYTCTVMTSLSRTRGIPMCCSSVLDAVWGRVFGGVHAGLRQGERKALVARGGQTGAVARHPVGWWFFTIRLGF